MTNDIWCNDLARKLRFHHCPFKFVIEVVEALFADPPVMIFRRVTVMQRIRLVRFVEFGPAKLTMIMLPGRTPRSIAGPNERRAMQIFVLALKPPVLLVHWIQFRSRLAVTGRQVRRVRTLRYSRLSHSGTVGGLGSAALVSI